MDLSDKMSGEKKKSGEDDESFPDKVVDPEILEDINRVYIPEGQGKSDVNAVNASSENKSDDSSLKKRRFKAICKRRRSPSPFCESGDVLISSFKRSAKRKKPDESKPCSKEADSSSSESFSSFVDIDSEDFVYSANSVAEEEDDDDAEITGQKVKKDTQLIRKKEKKAIAKKDTELVVKKAVATKNTQLVGKKDTNAVGKKVTKAPIKKALGKNDTQLVVKKDTKGVAKKETCAVVKNEKKVGTKKPKVDDAVTVDSGDDDVEVIESCNRSGLNQRVPYLLFLKDVLPILTDLHKSKIKEISFGPFLSLDLDYHKANFAAKLVCAGNYYQCTMCLHSDHVEIMKEDVELVYGLPSGGVVIDDSPDPLDKSWAVFVKRYRAIFGKSVSPTNIDVITEIKKHVAHAEHAVLNVVGMWIKLLSWTGVDMFIRVSSILLKSGTIMLLFLLGHYPF